MRIEPPMSEPVASVVVPEASDAPAPPLNDLLRVGLDAHAEEPALVSAVRSMNWRELEEESERLAGAYRGLGLEPGDRVASLMPNRIALIVHYLACFKAELVATPPGDDEVETRMDAAWRAIDAYAASLPEPGTASDNHDQPGWWLAASLGRMTDVSRRVYRALS